MANSFYNRAARKILDGTINLSTATLKIMLLKTGYTFSPDHDFVSSGAGTVGANEVTGGTGYAGGFNGAGRKTLANKAFSEDDANDRGEMDVDDVTWTAINVGDVVAAVVIIEGTSDADSQLVAYIDSGFPKTTNGGDLTLQINAEGLFHLSTV